MSQSQKTLRTHAFRASTIPQTTIRRLSVMPSYFFLIWRWSMWLYALLVIIFSHTRYDNPQVPFYQIATLLLVITFVETLIVTFYAPVIQILLPYLGSSSSRKGENTSQRLSRKALRSLEEDELEIIPPFAQTQNHYWNVAIYTTDVIICGLIMYYSAPFSNPPFGLGSPFYRYGMSTIFAAAATYRYRGGLLAALGYNLFAILGMLLPAPGWNPITNAYTPNAVDIIGSLIDAPLVAILVAYLANLLENYSRSKLRERENARTQSALAHLGETLLRSTSSRQEMLTNSIPAIMNRRFDRLVIALIDLTSTTTTSTSQSSERSPLPISTQHPPQIYSESAVSEELLPDTSIQLIQQVQQSHSKLRTFEQNGRTSDGIARLYLPLRIDDHVQIILGAESRRSTPFTLQHERFLTIAGTQLLVALDNIRLSEQTVELAATAERGRIAREIHDGIAQLTYMLSLQAETCETQVERLMQASDPEDAEIFVPLKERLHKLVTVSKQALWETRNYMFSLKPLMSGATTLTRMLSTQISEFETISDLPTRLVVHGSEDLYDEPYRHSRRYAQIGTAIFRIVQEALTNAYKHAAATQLNVILTYTLEHIEVDISDDGKGLAVPERSEERPEGNDPHHIYSGRGMHGMKERAEELDGSLTVLPGPTRGTVVRICIPL